MYHTTDHFHHTLAKTINPATLTETPLMLYAWRPKIPSKRLLEDPKLFIALERKKVRLNNSLHGAYMVESAGRLRQFKGGKIRSTSSFYFERKKKDNLDMGGCLFRPEGPSVRDKLVRTPHLNFNMQYLIKKRKTHLAVNKLDQVDSL